jgi:hypothetical protein
MNCATSLVERKTAQINAFVAYAIRVITRSQNGIVRPQPRPNRYFGALSCSTYSQDSFNRARVSSTPTRQIFTISSSLR